MNRTKIAKILSFVSPPASYIVMRKYKRALAFTGGFIGVVFVFNLVFPMLLMIPAEYQWTGIFPVAAIALTSIYGVIDSYSIANSKPAGGFSNVSVDLGRGSGGLVDIRGERTPKS